MFSQIKGESDVRKIFNTADRNELQIISDFFNQFPFIACLSNKALYELISKMTIKEYYLQSYVYHEGEKN